MKNIKLKLKDLFEFLQATDIPHDSLKAVNHDIFVKTPSGDYTQLRGVIRKTDNKIRISTDKGNKITCGSKHIFIDNQGHEVFCENASKIMSVHGVETITLKEDVGFGDVYDIAIDAPHLYVTPNGLVHHNTTFIKNLIHRSKGDARVTYDEAVMSGDSLFAEFIESDAKFMIMEDADTFLKSRDDGNTMMHRFLNVSDGLISAQDKKLVFSTNLPSVRDIDSALMRPGRCFDVIEFRALTRAEAEVIAKEMDLELPDGPSFTLAEMFNVHASDGVNPDGTAKKRKVKRVGFVE